MLPLGNDLILGNSTANGEPVMLPRDERNTHLYVCGSTGTGKSKFLEHLIRQDIERWHIHKCGMLLLDPHGSLYDGIMRWMAAHRMNCPVIPIDLRDSTTAISYNVLRKRDKGDSGVTITNFVQAMAYVWGQSGTDATPRFELWAHNVLNTLYESGHTLLEAEYLLDASVPDIRRKLTKNLKLYTLIRAWENIKDFSPREFDETMGSTINRLRRFLATQKLRHMFGQDVGGKTLDLEKCLEKGYIVLVNLSTEGGWVSNEDSSLFATLLLSDLWAAAQARGKHKDNRPFYLYADEFQNFVTPTMAKNLDEARGYGLHLTLAHQFPNQILHAGAHGQQVFDSIMENARSKVVFQVGTTNLEQLAKILFMGVLNPEQIKHRLYSTKVMDYRKVLLASSGRSSGRNRGSGYNERSAEAIDPEDPMGRINLDSTGSSNYEVDSDASTEGTSEAYSPVLGKELSSFAYRPLDEQLYLAMATLFEQEQRHCVVRTREMKNPVSIVAPIVDEAPVVEDQFKAYLEKMLRQTNIAHPVEEVLRQLARRDKQLQKIDAPSIDEEPVSAKRKLASADVKKVS